MTLPSLHWLRDEVLLDLGVEWIRLTLRQPLIWFEAWVSSCWGCVGRVAAVYRIVGGFRGRIRLHFVGLLLSQSIRLPLSMRDFERAFSQLGATMTVQYGCLHGGPLFLLRGVGGGPA